MRSAKFSQLGKILSLAVFLMVLFALEQQAKSEDGVIWTKDFSPYKLLNAVFSPDDKFIYATCTDIYYVIKYDLQGNILDTIKNVGGIRMFSEDGKYFWNVYGDKYNYPSFSKVTSIVENLVRTNFNFQASTINEQLNIGVIWDGGYYSPGQYEATIKNNLVIFRPSDMTIIRDTCYPGEKFDYRSVAIHPTNGTMAIYIADMKRQEHGTYRAQNERLEIWDINNYQKLRVVSSKVIGENDAETIALLRYSPDGSVLGYQHDGKLTLYSTTDYSVVWESEKMSIRNFNWTKDNTELLLSFYKNIDSMGICRMSNENKTIRHIYWPASGVIFINQSNNGSHLIVDNSGDLELLDAVFTSVSDPFITKYYKTNVNQDATNNILTLTINATNSVPAMYSITDTLGKTYTKQSNLNLEQGLNQFDIDISTLPSGNYFLQLTIAGHSQTIKFIVVR